MIYLFFDAIYKSNQDKSSENYLQYFLLDDMLYRLKFTKSVRNHPDSKKNYGGNRNEQ